MKDEEEKKPLNWEVCDPKPPVIRAGMHGTTGSYPTFPGDARASHLSE